MLGGNVLGLGIAERPNLVSPYPLARKVYKVLVLPTGFAYFAQGPFYGLLCEAGQPNGCTHRHALTETGNYPRAVLDTQAIHCVQLYVSAYVKSSL